MSSQPLDEELYEQVKTEAKQRFAVWPSAYASGWLVREYKRRGGRYADDQYNVQHAQPTGLTKWFGEEWVDISRPIYDKHGELVGYEPCGRPHSSQVNYPKCRPIAEAMRMTRSEVVSAVKRKRAAESMTAPVKGRPPVMVPTYVNPTTVVECGCGWSWEVEYDDPDPLLCHKCWGQYGVELVRR